MPTIQSFSSKIADPLLGGVLAKTTPEAVLFSQNPLTWLFQKVQTIWNNVVRAWEESFKDVPKVFLPDHPKPNTYPRDYAAIPWPAYLNAAWGNAWINGSKPEYPEGMATKNEPLEHVTPLHAASLGSNWEGMYRLIADGADVNAKDIRGQTPAYWAAYHGNLKALMILASYGADLHLIDFRGKSLLRTAAKYGHDDVVAFLMSHGADVNAFDGKGLTPLHVDAFHQRFSTYEKLLFHGADPTIKDSFGRTAAEILQLKCAEMYHNTCFLSRIFSSPTPPSPSLMPWKIEILAQKAI